MDFQEAFGDKRDEILRIARSHGATRVRVFGSFARGTADETSDVDFLIDLEPQRHLLDLAAIKFELEDLLGREVDVLTEAGVSRYVRQDIVRGAVPL
jgi:predicted nucleotidyltransferase